jgi:predicted nucleotidyltransferase
MGVNMDASIKSLVGDLKEGLRALYASRLQEVYVFGSRIRGNAAADSDLDVLVVLDRVEDYGAEITRTSHLVSELSLKHGITVSRVFASFKDWQEAKTAFVRSVREEGVAA